MGSKSCCSVMVGIATVVLTLTACSSPPSELRWPPPAPSSSPSTANFWLGSPTTFMCRVADDVDEGVVGVYFLEVHSAAFDFSPCNSGAARIPVRLGDPQGFWGDGMQLQKRCMYGAATDARVNGYVNVYGSARPSDLAAANRLCAAHQGVKPP